MTPQHPWPCPTHHLFHLFAFGRLIAVYRTLFAGRFLLAKHAFIQPLVGVLIQRRIVPRGFRCLRTLLFIQRDHLADGLFFARDPFS